MPVKFPQNTLNILMLLLAGLILVVLPPFPPLMEAMDSLTNILSGWATNQVRCHIYIRLSPRKLLQLRSGSLITITKA